MGIHIVKTGDNSITLFNSEIGEHYHSIHGAKEESEFVFIKTGLNFINKKNLNILEIGFGTGLNLILTYKNNIGLKSKILYDAIELYPIDIEIINKMNFHDKEEIFFSIHDSPWDKKNYISEYFVYRKINKDFVNYKLDQKYDLVYFDAFSPEKQPELWTFDIFKKIFTNMNANGVLVTYSSKGIVKRALREAGFLVERLEGPPKKRHIIRAIKKEHS